MEAVIAKYREKTPASSALLAQLPTLIDKKLWNEFTNAVLEYVFTPGVRSAIEFDFYTNFIKYYQSNLDQIKLLKIIYVVIENLKDQQAYDFLVDLENRSYFSEQPKIICKSLQGCKLVNLDLEKCAGLLETVRTELEGKSNFDNFVYFTFYRFSFLYYRKKGEFKQFYSNTLQSIAYSTPEYVYNEEKHSLSLEMALSVLASPDMYNFSELIEQPLLKSLSETPDKWAYDALRVFSRGNIKEYETLMTSAGANNKLLTENKTVLDTKIRLMAFLELLFHLPKNERIVRFERISKQCSLPLENVELLLMKAMALELIKGKIDQIAQTVTVSWIIPRVLDEDSIKVMRGKFEKWNNDLKDIIRTVKDPSYLADQ